jgi:8-hydroxy-5-deazaflavin:NADPH oxidoreductase
MVITIVGTGNMARGIATRALAGGHSVTLLGTESAKAQALADELSGDVSAGEVGDPLTGDVVVLAVSYAAVRRCPRPLRRPARRQSRRRRHESD